MINNCTLFHGNCFDILPKLDVVADAVISDPPFGITEADWDKAPPLDTMWTLLDAKTKPTANFVMFGCGKFSINLVNSKYRWYRYDLIWVKNNKVGFLNANTQPMRSHEQILVFGRSGFRAAATYQPVKTPGGRAFTTRTRTRQGGVYPASTYMSESDGMRHPCSVLSFDNDRGNNQTGLSLHPTQKPLALMEWLVRTYTNEGDVVLDPFMGSGTTGVACAKLNRRFIGIERESNFFEMAADRIRALQLGNLFADAS